MHMDLETLLHTAFYHGVIDEDTSVRVEEVHFLERSR